VDGLIARLEAGVRVIHVGCGLGSATILMAEAFPASTFVGVVCREESVRRATAAAEEAGVFDRVRFEVGDPSTYTQAGPARLTGAFTDAGYSTAQVTAATPFNLVIGACA